MLSPNPIIQNSAVVEAIDTHCIPGYARLSQEVQKEFETETYLGRRLVALIKLRDEFNETAEHPSSTKWYIPTWHTMQASVDILFFYRAKAIFKKAIPHLKRERAQEYESMLAAVKSVNEKPLQVEQSTDSSQRMIFSFIKYLSQIAGSAITRSYVHECASPLIYSAVIGNDSYLKDQSNCSTINQARP